MKPLISKKTISAVQRIISGNSTDSDARLSPYRSGPDLVTFFNAFGFKDTYAYQGGFPSRWAYAEACLEKLNGSETLAKAIEAAVDPVTYLDTHFDLPAAVSYLNQFLEFDGFRLIQKGKRYRLVESNAGGVTSDVPLRPDQHVSHEFIVEQIDKCDSKLAEADYDGAITNARSVVVAVLCDIEIRLDSDAASYDGDLQKLFKRVQKLLNLDPDRQDISDSLRQLLRGLVSVIAGLAPLRNKMGDAHVRTYKPSRHHAKLAVNSAKNAYGLHL